MQEIMIHARNITKSFGTVNVLKGIDLEVKKLEIVSIVGASGAGKTTLLQILGTLNKPDTGEIIIDGTEVSRLRDRELARFRNRNIGFVFQFHHLLPEFTALENVCIPAFIAGVPRGEAIRKATEILAFFGLKHRLNHKPSELSGGEQQRVAIARALINNPSVILADEPSGNLDSKNKKELHELFLTLPERFGQTLVIATHDQELAAMAHRRLKIADGRFEQ
jgi:lipoprotein-releasing system ATP-binding protein